MITVGPFFQNEIVSRTIPEALTPREETHTVFLILILSMSFLLIALSRNLNSRSLGTVVEIFFRDSHQLELQLKENMKIGSLSSVVLIINFFVSFVLCNFIFFQRILLVNDEQSFRLAFIIPVLLFSIETVGILIVSVLSGELKRLKPTLLNTLTISQFAGVFFTLIALFWIMNPIGDKLFLSLFLAVVALKVISRVLKSFGVVLSGGIRWYYVILYFCTLEILPLFVVSNYLLKNFLR